MPVHSGPLHRACRLMIRGVTTLAVAPALLVACTSSTPDSGPPSEAARTAPPVRGLSVGDTVLTIVAAGDIARRPADGRGTARLIRSIGPDAVLALGDNAYDKGSFTEFQRNYDPTWGAFREITRPIPGNHEYETHQASGYFRYFRSQIHGRPYYAWDSGRWRMYALNCEEDCGRDSKQLTWLQKDLAAHQDRPALAYVHEPYYTCSTRHPPLRRLDDIWAALEQANGQLVLSGNNHSYERFARLDMRGQPNADGLRQFVVGTGGASLYRLRSSCPHREAQTDETAGVLKLELRPDSFSWQFIAVGGKVLDSGSDRVT